MRTKSTAVRAARHFRDLPGRPEGPAAPTPSRENGRRHQHEPDDEENDGRSLVEAGMEHAQRLVVERAQGVAERGEEVGGAGPSRPREELVHPDREGNEDDQEGHEPH